ncbi:MAG: large subunit ribosomal protein L15, partial [Candidatus Omnitrophota bacterium]
MYLHELKAPKGSRKRKRIVGRGRGSGVGKTAGKGENGQNSRSGVGTMRQSEGGQTPLIRRLPKVGFTCSTSVYNQVVSLAAIEVKFTKGDIVNLESLKEKGLINSIRKPFKVLANGNITIAVTVETKSISKSAQEKIEKAGGKVELIESKKQPQV